MVRGAVGLCSRLVFVSLDEVKGLGLIALIYLIELTAQFIGDGEKIFFRTFLGMLVAIVASMMASPCF